MLFDSKLIRLKRNVIGAILGLVLATVIACQDGDESGSSTIGLDATNTPVPTAASDFPTQTPDSTPTTVPVATPTTGGGGSSTATATVRSAPTATAPAPPSGPSGSIVFPVTELFDVHAIHYLTPGFRPSGPGQAGSVNENLFKFRDGNPMTPNMVDSWSIDPDGKKVTIEILPNIPWNGPRDLSMDFGDLTADDVVEFLNRTNNNLNPDCRGGNCGDLGAIFAEATTIDDLTLEIDLRIPVFFCLPLSSFGCLGAGGAVDRVKTVDEMGEEFAKQTWITTGPFVAGDCKGGDRCTVHAVENHFRKTSEVAEVTAIQVPEPATMTAGLLNGTFDLVQAPFHVVPDLLSRNSDSIHYIEVGQFIGQSIVFAGNLWEELHAITGEPLNPWDSPAYEKDYPWIGDPWQESHPEKVRYVDDNNPPGMTDMEQARLVRLALSYAIDRKSINENIMFGLGEELYSEYMGPLYQGWDPDRSTGAWDSEGNRITASGTNQSVPWLIEFDMNEANRLLDLAGYPRDNQGKRSGFGKFTFDGGASGELGPNNIPISDGLASDWSELGLEVEYFDRGYGEFISPGLRKREHFYPVFKNGDIHSNIWPTDFPLPPVDSSITRPGWGIGFESKPGARWFFEITSESDPAKRMEMQQSWIDYSMFWVQYAGVYQAPVGTLASKRIADWPQPERRFFAFWPVQHEYIQLAQ